MAPPRSDADDFREVSSSASRRDATTATRLSVADTRVRQDRFADTTRRAPRPHARDDDRGGRRRGGPPRTPRGRRVRLSPVRRAVHRPPSPSPLVRSTTPPPTSIDRHRPTRPTPPSSPPPSVPVDDASPGDVTRRASPADFVRIAQHLASDVAALVETAGADDARGVEAATHAIVRSCASSASVSATTPNAADANARRIEQGLRRLLAAIDAESRAASCDLRTLLDELVTYVQSGVMLSRKSEVRSIHWFPYDRVRVVNADP
ncbi:uncharacterized protein MICPUCDRAFT_51910 [Micromonas pusilla CCMP1545]|uniref:Predicted protein n=1 Tax=Micromonas pusilla (strain CCMP1545) TaxID=564608 RepID=C1N2A5_MICPC|nr:uncharacterized protein MICPUCDRAFT_51910 [Micromonas pusilla CCMP1545]EEH53766.1 predicted protein [Micromonas pusilla CCMP1545]|eukprot:XP_003062054.1 predicted protein [Micromonas pusilla CCMP1545]